MRIQIQREDLLKPLSLVGGAAERRQTLPILSNVLLRMNDAGLVLTGTDLEVEVIARTNQTKGEAGEMTLPARKLLEICRALPAQATLDIKQEKDKATLKSGRSRFSLLTLPASDFPSIETAQWEQSLVLEQKPLKTLLEKTQFCMAQQDVRYYLNGMLFDLNGKQLRAVATDGHRMAVGEIALSSPMDPARQLIVPRKGIQEIIRFLGDEKAEVQVQINPNHIRINLADLTFTCKLIDGRYPDYTKVIPSGQRTLLRIGREALRGTLGRVAILSNEKFRGVRLSLKPGSMNIVAHNPEHEEAQEEMTVDYKGEELEIGFNANYILDAVAALESDDIELGLSDANSSCTLHSPGDTSQQYVVMPMRL
ncbi:MAG: DNA polymerase III subunit beta [Candidatus Muproteobacteria bacterium RBG_16_64_11]|uniref:Beta sliding clamp n=1 Tax=Candidatus Muproteobacteria bacterium RBG_16_64_11 TaxID=1817758 RepID=A0A1F6TAD6_9PROT|nr:MAG: DNA polymerase III subunit beta [Candidatus Muproteobacteria bacterium RBG_16_64_11]